MPETKLSVWRTALLAVHFCFKYAPPLTLYLAQYMLVTILVTLVLIPAVTTDFPTIGFAIGYAVGVYVWCPIAIAIHRRILSDEPLTPASYFYSLGNNRTFEFFAYSMLFIGLAVLIVGIPFRLLGVDNLLGALATLLAAVVAMAFLIRLALVFPEIALDKHQSLSKAQQLLSGSTWRFLWASALVGTPLMIAQSFALQFLSGWSADVFARFMGALVGLLTIAVVSFTYSFANRR